MNISNTLNSSLPSSIICGICAEFILLTPSEQMHKKVAFKGITYFML